MTEDRFREGVRLFNTQRFFEAHEALETLWLKVSGDQKTFLHGLIQLAAAFHHHTHNNPAGFHSLLEKGCTKLEKFDTEYLGVELADLMLQLQPWRQKACQISHHVGPTQPFPQVKIISRRYNG